MTTGILINCRLGSSRLPRKPLLEVGGSPILAYLIRRIVRGFEDEIKAGRVRVYIASPDEPLSRDLETLEREGAKVRYGSALNLPLRQAQIAKMEGLGTVLNVDGDDILNSITGLRRVYSALESGAEYARTSGLPFGMNSMGYANGFLQESVGHSPPDVLETGWGRIFDQKAVHEIPIEFPRHPDTLRLSLDYPEDLAFFKAVIGHFGDRIYRATDEEITEAAISRGYYRLNAGRAQEYWENFKRKVAVERAEASDPEGDMMNYSDRLHKAIPGGAHTYSRGDDQYPEEAPQILARGEGAYVWDAENRRYLDYGMALRAITVGYAEKRISEAGIAEIWKGNNLTRASLTELEAAEALIDLIPCAEMVKFAKNGSTVTTAALKLARAYTKRKRIAICADHPFFSFDDWFIGNTVMDSGVPEEHGALTVKFKYNDIASAEGLFARYPGEIAAVMLEPATTVEPADGFLSKLHALCRKEGAVFILDEMITGFRWHLQGAQRHFGVTPDLATFGKGMANGFSVAALTGRRDIMELGGIRKEGAERLFLISTTHGAEMSGLGALLKTIEVYRKDNVVDHLWDYGRKLVGGMNALAKEAGISDYFCLEGFPCSPAYTTRGKDGNLSLEFRTLFQQEMLRSGILMPWIALSFAHGQAELDATLEAGRKAMKRYAQALEGGIGDFLSGRPIKPVFRKAN